MTADLKQKEGRAWENVGRNDIRAAVSASIAAALSPVLESVERLEYDAGEPLSAILNNLAGRLSILEGDDEPKAPKPPAPRPPCWRPKTSDAKENDVCEHCPNCHGERDKDGCCAGCGREFEAGTTPPAPPATQGIPQSGPQAPERIRLQFRGGTPFIGGTLQPALNVSDAEYVRADLLEAAEAKLDHSQRKYRASCRHIEELAREGEEKRARLEAAIVLATTRYQAIQTLEADRQHLTNALRASTDKLASAERRIAELEQRVRIAGEDMGIVAEQHLAEGREAGLREAAEDIKQHGWTVAHGRVLALLAPCAICNGARWVCDVSVDGASYHRSPCPECSKPAAGPEGTLQHNPGLGSVTMSTEQAAALLKSSKPAASPEGEKPRAPLTVQPGGYVQFDVSCPNGHDPREPMRLVDAGTDGGLPWATFQCETCMKADADSADPPTHSPAPAATDFRGTIAPGTTISVDVGPGQNISPAESKGNGQWRVGRKLGRTLYIGDKCIGMVDTPELAAAIVEAMNAPSPAESKGKSDWADWMATNEYHQSLGAKWMCEAIVSKYAPDEREIVHAFARKWQDASFWRPKTEEEAGPLFNFCKKCDAFRGPDVTVCNVCGSPISKLREPPKTEEARKAVGPDAQPTEPATPATQDIPQNGPQAPERVEMFEMVHSDGDRYWTSRRKRVGTDGSPKPDAQGGTEYVRADVHAKACIDSRRLGEEHVRLLDERGDFYGGSRPWRCEKELEKARTALASAERRIAELEGNNAAIQADLADFTNAAFANGRAEGREAGVREAAEVTREELATMRSWLMTWGPLGQPNWCDPKGLSVPVAKVSLERLLDAAQRGVEGFEQDSISHSEQHGEPHDPAR